VCSVGIGGTAPVTDAEEPPSRALSSFVGLPVELDLHATVRDSLYLEPVLRTYNSGLPWLYVPVSRHSRSTETTVMISPRQTNSRSQTDALRPPQIPCLSARRIMRD
jgi:hypothetical protein